jgi:hypothetical protein
MAGGGRAPARPAIHAIFCSTVLPWAPSGCPKQDESKIAPSSLRASDPRALIILFLIAVFAFEARAPSASGRTTYPAKLSAYATKAAAISAIPA